MAGGLLLSSLRRQGRVSGVDHHVVCCVVLRCAEIDQACGCACVQHAAAWHAVLSGGGVTSYTSRPSRSKEGCACVQLFNQSVCMVWKCNGTFDLGGCCLRCVVEQALACRHQWMCDAPSCSRACSHRRCGGRAYKWPKQNAAVVQGPAYCLRLCMMWFVCTYQQRVPAECVCMCVHRAIFQWLSCMAVHAQGGCLCQTFEWHFVTVIRHTADGYIHRLLFSCLLGPVARHVPYTAAAWSL